MNLSKKIKQILTVIVLMGTHQLFAADGSSGCGLGWAVLNKNSLVSSFTRSFINATFSNTIAMTSGTSGCAKHDIVKIEKEQIHFTEANYFVLMSQMSQGKGEHLETYGLVMGCRTEDLGSFSQTMKNNFEKIYSNENITPDQVLKNVQEQIKKVPALSKKCNFNSIS